MLPADSARQKGAEQEGTACLSPVRQGPSVPANAPEQHACARAGKWSQPPACWQWTVQQQHAPASTCKSPRMHCTAQP